MDDEIFALSAEKARITDLFSNLAIGKWNRSFFLFSSKWNKDLIQVVFMAKLW